MNFKLIQIRINSTSFQLHSAIISIGAAQHALTGVFPALTLAVARSMRHGLWHMHAGAYAHVSLHASCAL